MKRSSAIVLGGGGVTGIAWEIGVLAGLLEAGVDLEADAVFGTSAGSFVGTALAAGADIEQLYATQQAPAVDESVTAASSELTAAWGGAFLQGRGNPEQVGAAFGAVARRFTPQVSVEERRRTVLARLHTTQWPATLHVTATDADTGVLTAFDHTCGHPLAEVVSASGAVPGISPMVLFGGRTWIDAGMVSAANARLADGYERVLVIAPMPNGHGGIPSAHQDVEAMRATSRVELITPDEQSVEAIGPNPYDPARRGPVAAAGRTQGRSAAAAVADLWR
ncbi:NTE family protein [Streptomyces sp. yr375]|uniref:patatin-like phospholipase family protein n=1 Tax=Streptomyces sp. yr375 TaxID=1761906 RepID=UPI0008C42AC1|nr:patatin-like phospholipase family protein [Streptomyces sp. yr375]SES39367.1 NTE family protein [Streptomyces sp. yr375]